MIVLYYSGSSLLTVTWFPAHGLMGSSLTSANTTILPVNLRHFLSPPYWEWLVG